MSKRNYIEEIVEKKKRLLKKTSRYDNFRKRIHPVVAGFRAIKDLDSKTDYRKEWLKYGAIGYIASIEGYVRLLIADLINQGEPYLANASRFKDIKVSIENLVAIHSGNITLGDYVAHFLPINSTNDINVNFSTILGIDLHSTIAESPCSAWNSKSVIEVFPEIFLRTQRLFELRHLYAHELATKEKISVTEIENCISSASFYITYIEEIIQTKF